MGGDYAISLKVAGSSPDVSVYLILLAGAGVA
jgi:hypothetical protein